MNRRKISFEDACAQYPHRFTMDHTPAWARNPMPNGGWYAPQFASDREWYALTIFPGEPGNEKARKYCYSTGQTWPLGKELDVPYRKEPK